MNDRYAIDFFQSTTGHNQIPTVVLRLKRDGEILKEQIEIGQGSFDATWKAVAKATKTKLHPLVPKFQHIGPFECPCWEAEMQLRNGGSEGYVGKAKHPDMVTAFAKACVNALNKAEAAKAA